MARKGQRSHQVPSLEKKRKEEEEEKQAKDKGMQLSYQCHLSVSSMIICM